MRKLIIFLVRKKIGLKKFEQFRFAEQKSNSVYYFTESNLMKKTEKGNVVASSVSLNWLLDDDCRVMRLDDIYKIVPLSQSNIDFKEMVSHGD